MAKALSGSRPGTQIIHDGRFFRYNEALNETDAKMLAAAGYNVADVPNNKVWKRKPAEHFGNAHIPPPHTDPDVDPHTLSA